MYLDELSTVEFKKKVNSKSIVILPIGAVEEHGPHLPLSTDSLQPEFIAEQLAKKTGAFIAPPIRYGQCSSTQNFPGTISISFDTLKFLVRDVLFELVRNGFKNIIVLSGHAGAVHMVALRLAAKEVIDSHDVKLMVLSDYELAYELKGKMFPEDDGHAGMIETSRIMAISPKTIKGKGKKGMNTLPKFIVVRRPEKYWRGITGDPTRATKDTGKKINEYIIKELLKYIKKEFR